MKVIVETIIALHFLVILLGCFGLMLWVQEEFESILKRKKIVGFSFLKISFYKKAFENNNLKRESAFRSTIASLRFFLTIGPLLLIPFSDTVLLYGEEFKLGIVQYENSFILFIFLLIVNELIRPLLSNDRAMSEKNILMFMIFISSFLLIGKFYSFTEIIEYQNTYTEFGIRRYLIYLNPIGAIALFQIIINEIDNPSDSFDIVKLSLINCYLTLFIFCFLGGFSAPTFFNFENRSVINAIVCTVSFISKYIFILVSIWVYRFVFVKRKREIVFNEF